MRAFAAVVVGLCVLGLIGTEAWAIMFVAAGMHHKAYVTAVVWAVLAVVLLVLEFITLRANKVA